MAGVMALLASSLLERQEDYEGNSRFRMLQTIREYALNQLAISGELEKLKQQHAQYFLKMAQEAEKAWDGPDEWDWLRRLVVVRDDLRAALRFAIENQDAVLALRLNAALFSFWNTCSILTEARGWIEAALVLAQSNKLFESELELVALKAKVLNVAGYMTMALSELEQAYAYFEQGLALYRKIDDRWGVAWSIRNFALIDLAWAKYAEVEKLLGESLKICEGSGDKWGLAWTLYATAFLKLAQGELDQAKGLLEQSLVHLRQQKMKFGIYRALLGLGYTLFEQGDTVGAEAYFREALSLNGETPLLTLMTTGLVGLGMVAAVKGEPYRAARIWGAVEALREMTGEHPFATYQRSYERTLKAVRSQVDVAEWRATWAKGRSLTLPQVLVEELNDTNTTPVENYL
jgi:tetratricopeptide (TPR) repeat protein